MSFKYSGLLALFATSLVLLVCVAQRTQTEVFATTQTQNAPPKEVAGIPVNYDEALVGSYTLPDPLVLANGKPVRDAKTWLQKRRPEIVSLFEDNQFGRSPGRPKDMSFDVFDKGTPALDGKAVRRQVTVYFSSDKNGPKMDLLIYLPAAARKPVPLLLNLSFSCELDYGRRSGNQTRRNLGPRQEESAGVTRQIFWSLKHCSFVGPGDRRRDGLLRRY